MKIKCPCCEESFVPSEDHLRWPSTDEINYPADTFVWESIPLKRSEFFWSDMEDNSNVIHNSKDEDSAKNIGDDSQI